MVGDGTLFYYFTESVIKKKYLSLTVLTHDFTKSLMMFRP